MLTEEREREQRANVEKVEEAVALVRQALGASASSIMVVSGVVDGEVSGVVLDDDGDDYVSSQELADGAIYLVVGLGNLATDREPGVAPLEVS